MAKQLCADRVHSMHVCMKMPENGSKKNNEDAK